MRAVASKEGAGILVWLTRDDFDRLAATGSYVSMQALDGNPTVVALVIEEPEDVQ